MILTAWCRGAYLEKERMLAAKKVMAATSANQRLIRFPGKKQERLIT